MISTVAGYRDPHLQATEGINSAQLGITNSVASYPGRFTLAHLATSTLTDVPCPRVVKRWEESIYARGRSVL